MPFVDKTVFNIRARNPTAMKDVERLNSSNDDGVFHKPFQTDAALQEETPEQMLRKKTKRLLQQAALNKSSAT